MIGDGLGDVPYEPNDNVDRLLWMYPQVRLLMNSPSIEMLRWVQHAFPMMKSPGVQDSHPLMRMPTEKLLPAAKETRPGMQGTSSASSSATAACRCCTILT